MFKTTIMLATTLLVSSLSFANVDTVKANLVKNHTNLQIDHVQATEMKGIYSASMQGQVVYLNEDAKHIIAGSMIRLQDQHNLTRDLLIQQNSIDWKKLPLKDALKTVKGTGKRQLAIFSDPNCPYCKQLELELAKLNDVTIYTFVLPLKSQSVAPSKQLFCEKNPEQAWHDLIVKGVKPASTKACDNPIQRNIDLAKSLQLNGTPAIILSNGLKFMGAHPADQLEKMFAEFSL
ncbi:thiol:disulfide interchange protein [Acinetobacter sp. NCu2D-2]|uniref:DsbC family protein n=1 Tax=Acinetobacter sp. NCu2D-2 TaxID=1608473 RepID=UPI0007CD9FC7|nr:DsbC family protein [Acinetobacter sp. NCu2D-2]ANF83194.1 thiol:disulfide interchange protein [Acinetobacter sp. NCu2D-2]